MDRAKERCVVFLPGVIQPAKLQYARLLEALVPDVQPLVKDLELYAAGPPVPGYALTDEVDGLLRAADTAGMGRFHLVGYSGGGAVALAFAGAYPQLLLSLALVEPAVIPSRAWRDAESAYWGQMLQMMELPDRDLTQDFIRVELKEGVPLPPPPVGDPPSWMATRPAGIRTLVHAMSAYDLSYDRLRTYKQPAYLAVGGLSNPIELRKAEILKGLLPNLRVEVYPDRHHFDPPQRAEPERLARALKELWERAEN